MQSKQSSQCAICSVKNPDKACREIDGIGPEFCPTKNHKEAIERALEEYNKPEIREFARMSTVQEFEGLLRSKSNADVRIPIKPRVQEICEIANKMGYKKLGVAFCAGLVPETRALNDILKAQGFEVVSVICKTGCTDKTHIGVKASHKNKPDGHESMCSPIVQATVLNEEKTDFNIMVGLCVGHDSLFLKYSEAFSTVLVAKDRFLAHNPVAALYTTGSYFSRMLKPGFDSSSASATDRQP